MFGSLPAWPMCLPPLADFNLHVCLKQTVTKQIKTKEETTREGERKKTRRQRRKTDQRKGGQDRRVPAVLPAAAD